MKKLSELYELIENAGGKYVFEGVEMTKDGDDGTVIFRRGGYVAFIMPHMDGKDVYLSSAKEFSDVRNLLRFMADICTLVDMRLDLQSVVEQKVFVEDPELIQGIDKLQAKIEAFREIFLGSREVILHK